MELLQNILGIVIALASGFSGSAAKIVGPAKDDNMSPFPARGTIQGRAAATAALTIVVDRKYGRVSLPRHSIPALMRWSAKRT